MGYAAGWHKDATGHLEPLHKEYIRMMDSGLEPAAYQAMSGHAPFLRSFVDARIGKRPPAIASLAISLALVAVAAALAAVLRGLIPAGSIALVFLVAVLLSAVFFGFWTGLAAAGLAFLAYNFFFVEPVLTFRVAHAEDFLALAVFVLVAGLTGTLAGRLREQATAAQEHARLLGHLSSLSNALGACTTEAEARQAMLLGLQQLTGKAVLLVDRTLATDPPLGPDDMQAADRALRHGVAQLAAASGWSGGRYSFYPLSADEHAPLAVGIDTAGMTPELGQAVTSAIEQSGAMLARLRLASEAEVARRQAERESLRAALLSSLSHDLKTPLATILGSVTTLRELSQSLPEAARDDLLLAIEEDAQRLSTYVVDLLHMTRLQSGLDLRLDWIDPCDILNGAVARLRRIYTGHTIRVFFDPNLPLLRTDAALLEQALFNCLDNAANITPANALITAALRLNDERLCYSIEDEGPGIPQGEHNRIFEPFQRGAAASHSGTGLGLAISKGIILALGGAIGVDSPLTEKGGARFRLTLPVAKEAST